MEDRKNIFMVVLFYGGLWGILEATLGFALHFLPPGFAGMFMFPIGFYFMYNAYRTTDQHSTIFYTALVAAALKLSNLILPFNTVMSAVNPAVSIILEGLVVLVGVRAIVMGKKLATPYLMSLSWTVLFPVFQALFLNQANGLQQESLLTVIGFIVLTTIVSGSIITTYLKKQDIASLFTIKIKQRNLLASLVVIVALIFELGNSILF
ncbi:MAG TPA: hypothetical protein VKP78_11730 [bacterium]|nr:hypothetical protein [bacterium]